MKDVQSDEEVDRNIEELSREALQYTDDGDVHARLLTGISEGETPPEYNNKVRNTYCNSA